MKVDVGAPYPTRVRQALDDSALGEALDRATSRLRDRRAAAMDAIAGERVRTEARAAKAYAIAHLPELLERLEQNLIANGCTVHWAQTGAEATAIVQDIARRCGARRIVKSKSMVTEEIHLNHALEEIGARVVETDLGEYIIQLAGEPPSHIIAPVIHKRVEDVSALFQRELGTPPTDDPAVLCDAARRALRDEFLQADMGISGCNFAIAETGTVCIITNEGNGRMVSSLPRVYVAVAGIEKVVATVEDALLLWQATTRSATGQDASVYFSMSGGPRGEGETDGPDEMHVVLLDHGRSRVAERGYADALLCVRCGACLNACPVYRQIGGHAYGETAYNGPIGAVITPLLADAPAAAKDLPYASSLCGACRDVCPVKIDLPRMLLDLRADLVEDGATPRAERVAMGVYARAATRPRRFHRLVRWAGRVAAWLQSTRIGRAVGMPPPLKRWMRTRALPPVPDRTFRERRRESTGSGP